MELPLECDEYFCAGLLPIVSVDDVSAKSVFFSVCVMLKPYDFVYFLSGFSLVRALGQL